MLRRLFTLVSAVSLVLCVATCVLWVRSYGRWDYLVCRPNVIGRGASAISCCGAVQWKTVRYEKSSLYAADARIGVGLESVDPHSTDQGDAVVWGDTFGWEADNGSLMFDESWSTWWSAEPPWLRAFAAGAGPGLYPGLRMGPVRPAYHLAYVVTPYWALGLAAAVVPGTRLVLRYRRRRTRRRGLCPNCGYDLRASPDRCPECGAVSTVRISS